MSVFSGIKLNLL